VSSNATRSRTPLSARFCIGVGRRCRWLIAATLQRARSNALTSGLTAERSRVSINNPRGWLSERSQSASLPPTTRHRVEASRNYGARERRSRDEPAVRVYRNVDYQAGKGGGSKEVLVGPRRLHRGERATTD